MTESQIDQEVEQIRTTSKSEAELQLRGLALLAKAIRSNNAPGDTYMGDIRAFHEKFGLGYASGPRPLPAVLADFREKFMQEELDEYKDAVRRGDLEKQFDALIDLVYVALGTAYLQGFPFAKGWARVQTANMAKIRTPKPTSRGGGFDVVKPPGWKAPELTDLVNPVE